MSCLMTGKNMKWRLIAQHYWLTEQNDGHSHFWVSFATKLHKAYSLSVILSHTQCCELLSDGLDPLLTQRPLWTVEGDVTTPPAVLPRSLHIRHCGRGTQRGDRVQRLNKTNLHCGIIYHIEHGEVINYTGWYINTPSHYKDTGVLPSSLDGDEGNRSGISTWG